MKRMYRHLLGVNLGTYIYVRLCPFLIVTVLIISETWKIEVGRPPIGV